MGVVELESPGPASRRGELAEQGRAAHAAAVGLLWELDVLESLEYADEAAQGPSPDLGTLDGQLAILGGILRECLVDPERPLEPRVVAEVSGVLDEVHAARFAIRDRSGHERLRRLERLDDGLARLRGITDQDELLEVVCQSAAAAGDFRRVMLSRVDSDRWRPWRSHAETIGPTERAFGDWIRAFPTIDLSQMLLESDLVALREPALVTDAANDPRVYAPLAEASGLRSYVAAPLLAGDRVIGLLHADNGGDRLGELDRDVLGFFAVGFAQVFERAVLVDRLREQRLQVQEALHTVEQVLEDLASSTIALVTRGEASAVAVSRPAQPAAVARATGLEELLTGRELEVLGLMATGATNDRIAQRLVIATGTVKSHVKQILRKLEVENRAEAISQYLRLTIGAGEG